MMRTHANRIKWVQMVQRQKREGMLSARLAGEPAKAGWDAFTTDSQAGDSLRVNAAGLVCSYVQLCLEIGCMR